MPTGDAATGARREVPRGDREGVEVRGPEEPDPGLLPGPGHPERLHEG